MASKLIFLEFVDQSQDWLANLKANSVLTSDFIVVSFHPKVKVFLKQQGIDCRESFEFCDTLAHGKLLEVLQEWTDAMRQKLSLQDENGVRESYVENLIFFTRSALSGWLYRTQVCLEAIKELQPQSVWVVENSSLTIVASPLTEASERYLGEMLSQRSDVKLERISPSSQSHKPFNNKPGWLMLAQEMVGRFNVWNAKHRGRKQVMALVNSHNMDQLLKDLSKSLGSEYECVFLGNRRLGTPTSVIWRDMTADDAPYRFLYYPTEKRVKEEPAFVHGKKKLKHDFEQLAKNWHYKDISPVTWITSKYHGAFQEMVIDATYFQSKALNRLWQQNRPTLVVSQHSRGVTAVAGELCRIKKIPSLMVPHGSFTPLRNPQAALEWRENARGLIDTSYEYVALQTPLAEKFIKDIQLSSKTLVTGPLIIGRSIAATQAQATLRKKLAPQGEKIILHASTPKHRQSQRFLNYETIDEYVQGMADLIRAVDTLQGYKLILRFRPIDGLTTDELKNLLPPSDHCLIASDGNFNDYLAVTDLLVSFSSTTMEEALLNNVAVLQYDKFARYEHIPGALLSLGNTWPGIKNVYTVRSFHDLAFALESIKTNHLNGNKELSFKTYRLDPEKCISLNHWIKDLNSPFDHAKKNNLPVICP